MGSKTLVARKENMGKYATLRSFNNNTKGACGENPDKVRVLVIDRKYEGKYVAFRSFNDKTIVACGRRPDKVIAKAIGAGVVEPVVMFVREHDVACIY